MGSHKRKMTVFRKKIAICLRKVCYKVFCAKTISDTVVGHSLANLVSTRAKMIGEDFPSCVKIWQILMIQPPL